MSGSATLDLERLLLEHTLAIAPMPTLARVYVALCRTAPTEVAGGIEASGGGYVRGAATFTLLATPANAAANATAVEFPPATSGWGTVTHFEIWTQATGGTRLYWGKLIDPADGAPIEIEVAGGSVLRFSPGSLVVQAADMDPVVGVPWLPTAGGEMTGPLYYTATGGTTARSAQDRAADVVNVLDFVGVDPTGVTDSSPAFAAALAIRRNGRPVDVFAPSGVYRLSSPITGGHAAYAQRLFGNGWSTVLLVGPDFPASANGVILATANPTSGGGQLAQFSVCDLQIQFQQPPDFSTTTTATTAIGSAVLTLASVVGIQVGYYCRNITSSGSLPFQSTMPKVVSIVGNVVTLDRTATLAIAAGHVMQFAANRSQAVDLATAPTLNAGAPAIRYPWAIYAPAQSVFIDHVLVAGAWNGIYIRGSTFVIGQYFVGCLNVGLDVDECYNFNKIDHFQLWGFGFGAASAAMYGVYYDGQTVAMNIGRCDDFCADIIQTWCGIVNLTSTWTWGAINQLKMDGSNANLNIAGSGWVHIGQMYSTGATDAIGVPIVVTDTCRVRIDDLHMNRLHNNPSITLAGGALTIKGGYLLNGQLGSWPMISVTGGALSLEQMRFDSSAGRTADYLTQTGGSVRVSNSAFIAAPGAGGKAFNLTDAVANSITDVELNGWAFTAPGPLGRYQGRTSAGVFYTNTSSHFIEIDTPTTAQVVLRSPGGVNGAESKLRFFGAFPTGGDTAPRLSSSIRAGFVTTSWTNPYLSFYLANGTNDVGSDANMVRTFQLTQTGVTFGYDAASTSVGINGSASLSRRVFFQTAGSARFEIALTGGTESGGNASSNLRFRRYDDAGAFIDDPFVVTRSNGITNITNLAIGTSAGPTIRSGTGAATGTQPKGSVWLRTDGAVGTTLYVSQGDGTWNAVAGV